MDMKSANLLQTLHICRFSHKMFRIANTMLELQLSLANASSMFNVIKKNLTSPSTKLLMSCKNECHPDPINPTDLLLILKYAIKWDCKQKCTDLFIILTATPGLPQAVIGTIKPSATK